MTPVVHVLASLAGQSSGYLIEAHGYRLLVDCGPGTTEALRKMGNLADLDAVIITHEHADHCSDTIGLAFARSFPDPLDPIPLLAPASAIGVLRRLDDLFAVPTLPQMGNTIDRSFHLQAAIPNGVATRVSDSTVQAFPVKHAVPSIAYRIGIGGTSIAFSSDTGICDGVAEAAADVDLFICEATYLTASDEELELHGHLTPALAGELAHAAGSRRLAIGHISREADGAESLREAGLHFDPDAIILAHKGAAISVGSAEERRTDRRHTARPRHR